MKGEEPDDPKKAALTKRKASSYSVFQGKLFRKGFSMPLLKFLEGEEAAYVLREKHEGICGHNLGGRSLAKKTLRAGYSSPL